MPHLIRIQRVLIDISSLHKQHGEEGKKNRFKEKGRKTRNDENGEREEKRNNANILLVKTAMKYNDSNPYFTRILFSSSFLLGKEFSFDIFSPSSSQSTLRFWTFKKNHLLSGNLSSGTKDCDWKDFYYLSSEKSAEKNYIENKFDVLHFILNGTISFLLNPLMATFSVTRKRAEKQWMWAVTIWSKLALKRVNKLIKIAHHELMDSVESFCGCSD